MKKIWFYLALISCCLISTAEAKHPDKEKVGPFPKHHMHGTVEEFVKDEVLIKFRVNFTGSDLQAFNHKMKANATSRFEAVNSFYQLTGASMKHRIVTGWDTVKLKKGQTVQAAITEYKDNPLIEVIEPNYKVYAAALSTTYTPTGVFNDPLYTDGHTQWWINRIKGDAVSNQSYVFQGGSDIVVAVLDTGVDLDHPEFAGRLLAGYDFVNSDSIPEDDNNYIGTVFVNGHGTHVAGVIIANGNNSSMIAGTAWDSRIKILPVKVLDSVGGGDYGNLAAGITWAANNGAHIINMSLGGYGNTQALTDAVTYANGQGKLMIAAAGNDDTNIASTSYYPACYSSVMAIAATAADDYVAIYSNFSTPPGTLDCSAPGGNFLVQSGWDTDYGVTATSRDGSTSAVEGTSFAAPQVSALAALLKLQVPSRTASDIRTLINSYCDDIGYPEYHGAGRINIMRALGDYKTPTSTLTSTPSLTATMTPTITQTSTPSPTLTITPTITQTSTHSPTATITPTITKTSTHSPTATITPTSTPVTMTRDEVRLYPQPARDEVRVAFDCTGTCKVTTNVYNMVGERVLSFAGEATPVSGFSIIALKTASVGSGLYIVHVVMEDAQGIREVKRKMVIAK